MYLLKYRSRGKSVKLTQELLTVFGTELVEDGYFGRVTEAAVKDFQQKNSLTADGIVFTETWARLLLLPPVIVRKKPITREEIQRLSTMFLKKGKKGSAVSTLQELLNHFGYNLTVDGDFGGGTDRAVKDFQQKNGLGVDGKVGKNTWAKLFQLAPPLFINPLKLSEQDIINFAKSFNLEVAVVKAVQEVESSGKGFLKDNRPTILFEGHIFWRELKNRGLNPSQFVTGNENVLYPRWTKEFYKGKAEEYQRLEKAKNIGKSPKILEAALAAASWGMFQIMGFNYRLTENFDVIDFVTSMKRSEANQLKAFGHFIDHTKLLNPLREKRWADFARGYNGKEFKKNKYDERLREAYLNHSATDLLG